MRLGSAGNRALACAGALLCCAGVAQSGAPWASVGPSVNPTDGEWHHEPFRPSVNEPMVPDHPPIDEIPPMPMPHSDDWRPNPNVRDTVVVYDAETGEAHELPLGQPSGLQGAQGGQSFIGADGNVVDEWSWFTRAFNDMDTVSNLTAWPWRGNVKLVMRFTDQNNQTRHFVCSGTMQDSGVVFTAAHCVYARSPNNIDIFDWAEEVWVYPAWDGEGSLTPGSHGHYEHWGWSHSTSYIAGSGWVNDGDFDRDVGAMRLRRTDTRQVGMLTGWFAWAWGFGCSTITDRTYHNASFPSEDCNGSLHTGRDMYYWFGRFDSCPGNQLQIDTTGGCFNAVWGGMSGSGAYYIDDGTRFTHAICSNSNRSTVGRYAKNWEGFIDAFQDMRDDVRGNTADWELLQFRTDGSLTVDAGNDIGPSSVQVTNPTNADPSPRTFTLRVYLSENNNIESSDTLLATYTYSDIDFSSMQVRQFNIPDVTIPPDTPPGDYYLGAILDPDTDPNPSNNNVWGWDAQPIEVTLSAPDQVSGPTPSDGATNQPRALDKSWSEAPTADSYRIHRGTDPSSLSLVSIESEPEYSVPASQHEYGQTYYWRVDSRNAAGTTTGEVWSYTIETEALGPSVLLTGAPGGAGFDDAKDKLASTNRFGTIDTHDASTSGSPVTLSQLLSYDAVLFWSNATYWDNDEFGDIMADYVDQGGGAVAAVFETSTTSSGRSLGGRWDSEQYWVIEPRSGNTSSEAELGDIEIGGHPAVQGVRSLEADRAFRPTTTQLSSHGELVAKWDDGRTLIAASGEMPGRVDLGLYPPSSDHNSSYWTGDGADLLAGALFYAARHTTGWITTTFDSNNGGGADWGVFFDVEVLNQGGLTFTGIDLNARNGEGETMEVEVYVIEGGSDLGDSSGASDSSTGWDLVATGTAVAGDDDKPTSVIFEDPFELEAGVYGMAVRTRGVGQNYTNGDGTNEFFANDDLELSLGMARNDSSGFGGSMFFPRVFNGVLHYESEQCIADWNGDGEVDINDFFAYLDDFEAGNPRADLNNDGEIDINDFFIFLDEFEQGC